VNKVNRTTTLNCRKPFKEEQRLKSKMKIKVCLISKRILMILKHDSRKSNKEKELSVQTLILV